MPVGILGAPWTASLVDGLVDDDGAACEGLCDAAAATLTFDRVAWEGPGRSRLWIHELLHAYIDAVAAEDRLPRTEEQQVEFYAAALANLERDGHVTIHPPPLE